MQTHKRNTLFHQVQQSLDRLLSFGLLQQREDKSIVLFRDRPGPCKKRKIAKAEPVAQNTYADTSKVLPDSDPTNKKSESTVTEPRGCGGPGRESEAGPGSREPEPRLTNAGLGQRADRGHCCLTRLSVTAEDFQVSLPY